MSADDSLPDDVETLNHSAPSGPAVMSWAGLPPAGMGYSVMDCAVASSAARVCVPWPLVVLVKEIVAGLALPVARAFALEFTEKVIVVPALSTVPEVDDAVSQLGTPEIE
jgi:hypothetical protein